MGKLLHLLICLLPALSFAQSHNVSETPTPQGVLLEEFTGIHCGYCPKGHAIAAAMEAYHHQVNVIAVHAGPYADPGSDEPDFRTNDGAYVNDHFGITGYPSGLVSRRDWGVNYILGRSSWEYAAKELMVENAEVNLWAKASYDYSEKTLTVDVEGFYMNLNNEPEQTYNVNVAVVQSRILGPQNGATMGDKYVHNHVLRMYMTPVTGDKVTVTDTDKFFAKTYSAELPSAIKGIDLNPLNLDVVVFITKAMDDVVNATTVHPSYSNCVIKGNFELTDNLIPYHTTSFAGNKVTACLTNLTPNMAEVLNVEVTMGSNKETYDIYLDEPLMPGQRQEVEFTLPATVGDSRTTATLNLLKADKKTINCEPLKLQFESVPHCATYGKVIVRADEDYAENTWTLCDIDGNVVLDCGVVPYTGKEVSFDVTLEDGKYYCLMVTDEWGNGVQNPRGIVKYVNSEGSMQVQNMSIAGFGTRLYFKADAACNPVDAVENINADSNATPEYYTIDGRRITNGKAGANAGIVIERRGTKTTKIAK